MSSARPPRVRPRLTSALEGRLYLVAVLAGGYLFAWRAIETTSTPGTPAPAPIREAARPPSPVVWLDDVPSGQRPVLVLPPEWQLASRGEPAVATPAPRVTRVPASRAVRVRTRSS